MRGSVALRAFAFFVLAAAGFVGSGLASGGTIGSFTGAYQGIFMNTIGGNVGDFTFTLSGAHNNQGDATLTAGGTTVPFKVTVGESNIFTAVGTGPAGFVAHGVATPFGDGSSREVAHYLFRSGAGGRPEGGTLFFLQSFPGAGELLPAIMTGSFLRDDGQTGQISVQLTQQGSEFQGVGMFGNLPFPFVGTIGETNPPEPDKPGTAPVHAISLSPFASIEIDGVMIGGVHLDGMVTATFGDGSVHTATFTLSGIGEVVGGGIGGG